MSKNSKQEAKNGSELPGVGLSNYSASTEVEI